MYASILFREQCELLMSLIIQSESRSDDSARENSDLLMHDGPNGVSAEEDDGETSGSDAGPVLKGTDDLSYRYIRCSVITNDA